MAQVFQEVISMSRQALTLMPASRMIGKLDDR